MQINVCIPLQQSSSEHPSSPKQRRLDPTDSDTSDDDSIPTSPDRPTRATTAARGAVRAHRRGWGTTRGGGGVGPMPCVDVVYVAVTAEDVVVAESVVGVVQLVLVEDVVVAEDVVVVLVGDMGPYLVMEEQLK